MRLCVFHGERHKTTTDATRRKVFGKSRARVGTLSDFGKDKTRHSRLANGGSKKQTSRLLNQQIE